MGLPKKKKLELVKFLKEGLDEDTLWGASYIQKELKKIDIPTWIDDDDEESVWIFRHKVEPHEGYGWKWFGRGIHAIDVLHALLNSIKFRYEDTYQGVGFRTDHLRGQFIGVLMKEEETSEENELEKNENEH